MAVDLRRVATVHVAALAALCGAAYATGWADPGSVLLGGVVMGANLWLLKVIASALLPGPDAEPSSGRAAFAVVALLLKFGLFLGLLAVLFMRVPIDLTGFVIGTTCLLFACVAAVLPGGARAAKGAG